MPSMDMEKSYYVPDSLFEEHSDYRLKAVVTINAKGEIHEWYHDQ